MFGSVLYECVVQKHLLIGEGSQCLSLFSEIRCTWLYESMLLSLWGHAVCIWIPLKQIGYSHLATVHHQKCCRSCAASLKTLRTDVLPIPASWLVKKTKYNVCLRSAKCPSTICSIPTMLHNSIPGGGTGRRRGVWNYLFTKKSNKVYFVFFNLDSRISGNKILPVIKKSNIQVVNNSSSLICS